jgi:hypothetical protein
MKSTLKFKTRIPSYIFKRHDFYYFRMTLPQQYWDKVVREIYLSLKTPFKKEAFNLAQYLH